MGFREPKLHRRANLVFAKATNKNIIMSSFKISGDIQKKEGGQTAVSDNQSSSVTLNELTNKARKIYCNFEFHEEVIQ